VFVPGYTEAAARDAVAQSFTYTATLRLLGLCPAGGNAALLKKWLARWEISTEHFDPRLARRAGAQPRTPLAEILVEQSAYARSNLKARLYDEGLKRPICERCGQGELWRGQPMALILDHVNGVRDDNRLENLQIVCPNCAATLDTHCGRKNRRAPIQRACLLCGTSFRVKYASHRYCSSECGTRAPRDDRGVARPGRRRAQRPPYEQLLRELAATNYTAVGRVYGVSDNAVRKWVRQYEREQAALPATLIPPAARAAPR
jgi:hypothetical protein